MKIQCRIHDIGNVLESNESGIQSFQGSRILKVGWDPPPTGWFKMNSDGSVRTNTGRASCGGLIRNGDGDFVAGFSCNMGSGTIMQAELMGILHELRLARSRNIDKVLVEVDSTSAIYFLENDCDPLHPCATIMHDIKDLLRQFTQVDWKHSFRESNCYADILANDGHGLDWGVHYFTHVPSFLSLAIFADLSGTLFDRMS